MAQLKMYRFANTPYKEAPLPEGYTISAYETEADKMAWVECCKKGLVADDAVDIKRVSAKTLVGSAPEIIRHFIELRGIGIIDVKKIFGMGAVKLTEKKEFTKFNHICY